MRDAMGHPRFMLVVDRQYGQAPPWAPPPVGGARWEVRWRFEPAGGTVSFSKHTRPSGNLRSREDKALRVIPFP